MPSARGPTVLAVVLLVLRLLNRRLKFLKRVKTVTSIREAIIFIQNNIF